jgi:hypothetical protein
MSESLMTEAATTTEGTTSQDVAGSTAAPATAPTASSETTASNQQQAANTQTADAAQAEGGETGGDKAPEGAPEKYDFKFEEGKTVDAGILDVYSEVAKELNLTQDAAQKMLSKLAPVIEGKQLQQIEAVKNEWTQASVTDKEFGGDKLQENLQVAEKALSEFGTDQLRALLKDSGLANNPEVIRFMYRAGKAISEDSFVGGNKGQKQKGPMNFNDHAAALYSNQQT